MSKKYIDILTGRVEIINQFEGLTEVTDYTDSTSGEKIPLFYMKSSSLDILFPKVFTSTSDLWEFIDQVEEQLQTEYNNLVEAWYGESSNTDYELGPGEAEIITLATIKSHAKDDTALSNFLTEYSLSSVKGLVKDFIFLTMIREYYGDKPLALCVYPKSLSSVISSSEEDDLEVLNRIHEEKSIKFIFNPRESGSTGMAICDEFSKNLNLLYYQVDRDFGDQNAPLPVTWGEVYGATSVETIEYSMNEATTNFVSEFIFKNSFGVASNLMHLPLNEILEEKEQEIIEQVSLYEIDTIGETVYWGADLGELAGVILAEELFSKYNRRTSNSTFDNIKIPGTPAYVFIGVGEQFETFDEDYKCLNMTSLVDEDGYLSHVVLKNEVDYYQKELNVRAGVFAASEETHKLLGRMSKEGKIKKSKLTEIKKVVFDKFEKLKNEGLFEGYSLNEVAFKEFTTDDETVEKLVVESTLTFILGISKIEVRNRNIF